MLTPTLTSIGRARHCGRHPVALHPQAPREVHQQEHQTVPRSEMYALLRCLMYLTQNGTPRPATIHSDNKAVVLGISKGRLAMSYGELQEDWMPIFDALDTLTQLGWSIQVIKVKGHITSEMIDRGEWTQHHKAGNDRADCVRSTGKCAEWGCGPACGAERRHQQSRRARRATKNQENFWHPHGTAGIR